MKYNILFFFVLVAALSFAQQKEIRGAVTSKSDGVPTMEAPACGGILENLTSSNY